MKTLRLIIALLITTTSCRLMGLEIYINDDNKACSEKIVVQQIIDGFEKGTAINIDNPNKNLDTVQIRENGHDILEIESATAFKISIGLIAIDKATDHIEKIVTLIEKATGITQPFKAKYKIGRLLPYEKNTVFPVEQLAKTKNETIISAIVNQSVKNDQVNTIVDNENNTLLHLLCSQEYGYNQFKIQIDKLIDAPTPPNFFATNKKGFIPLTMINSIDNNSDLVTFWKKYASTAMQKKLSINPAKTIKGYDEKYYSLFEYLWKKAETLQPELIKFCCQLNMTQTPLDSKNYCILHYIITKEDKSFLESNWNDELSKAFNVESMGSPKAFPAYNYENLTSLGLAYAMRFQDGIDFLKTKGAHLTKDQANSAATGLVTDQILEHRIYGSTMGPQKPSQEVVGLLKDLISRYKADANTFIPKAQQIFKTEHPPKQENTHYHNNVDSYLQDLKLELSKSSSGGGSSGSGSGDGSGGGAFGGFGSGGGSSSGTPANLDNLTAALNALKAKLVTLANALKK